ncbi:chemotaxis MotB protein [Jannaschia pagri]|uniref:Chemotaxis MotB protein n=1 Tax=Jannaschia pagri TaxID=2829797 RepID=A0ABQ4NQX2_9RHOB|nr:MULTISPECIES: flagellar motor protein MotB [unclassified Jannaschia]GIT92980.1 chemotaxis MotB protein [Jannaschia sp. AI_61]GIT96815.1 chemotaxis MotB protein [Jannaschia sp. AI_62]
MANEAQRPIIIKRKKVSGDGGHHGGAWKVAYADFVTAMMAFFMLMWLLNATTEKQRKGLADYFSPTVALSRSSGGGDGALGGRSLSSDASQIQLGRGGVTTTASHGSTQQDDTAFEAAEAALLGKGGDSLLDTEQLRHVSVRLTDEGMVIELFDLPNRSLFDGRSPTPLLKDLLASVAPILREQRAPLSLSAFTASEPIVTLVPRGWDLSTARAQALREALLPLQVPDDRIARLIGHADRRPADPNPLSSRNNRLEIVLLREGVNP